MSAPLSVAFDATPVISGRTGIARYVNDLGAALARQNAELRRFAVGRSSFPVPQGVRHVRVPARVCERWWRSISWPSIEQLVGDVDLVHATGLLMPATRRPLVATVHDIAAVRHPELHPDRHVRQQRAQLAMLERAAAIVTVSAATADDLVYLGVPAERLVVAPLGLTPLPEPDASLPSMGTFLLTVGETSPRKDYAVVVRALSRLDPSVELVIAGPPAGDEAHLRSLIEALGLQGRVRRLGAVSDAALAALYRSAAALCFTSRAEGFGLPVLEAMAAGLPVISRDIPAIRELAGDAALYVAGGDEAVWAETIDGLLSDPALRDKLADDGARRAAQFSWDRTAAATLDAYRLALGRPG